MSDYDEEEAKKYAEEKGNELETILAELDCEFATTACLKLTEPPRLLVKPVVSEKSAGEASNGDEPDEEFTLLLAANKDLIAAKVATEVKKYEEKNAKWQKKGKPWKCEYEIPESISTSLH